MENYLNDAHFLGKGNSPGESSGQSSRNPSGKKIFGKTLLVLFLILAAGLLGAFYGSSRVAPDGARDLAANSTDAGGSAYAASSEAWPSESGERKVLYWYDPMYPGTHFDKPGKSPFMDMDLAPRYAEEEAGEGITIDPAQLQNLGLKTALVKKGKLSLARDFPADVELDGYRRAVIQPRADGFVSRVVRRAVGDSVLEG